MRDSGSLLSGLARFSPPLETRVDPGRDIIYVNGNRLPKKLLPKVYFDLNKPKGYICSSGEKETRSVVSLLDDYLMIWNPNLVRMGITVRNKNELGPPNKTIQRIMK